jgi:putative ABC transport system permease protein
MIRTLRRVWNRLLGSFAGRRGDDDLASEFDAHIELLAEENLRRGLRPQEALRQAKLRFGAVEEAKESYRDQRGLPILDVLGRDLRYAFRGIRNNPGFAAVAILSLAIGIGANTAIFSIVNTVLLEPLAYEDPQRLFVARESPGVVNPLHALEWAKSCPSLEDVALMRGARVQINAGGDPESLIAVRAPHNLLSLFGVKPILGRPFLPEEDHEGSDAVILSESLWRTRFNADPALVGRSILLSDRPRVVVGIVPDSLRLPFSDGAVQIQFPVLLPLALTQDDLSRAMGNYNFTAVARLKPGATAEQAIAEMNVVEARFLEQAGSRENLTATLIPVHEFVTGRSRVGLLMLSGAVGAVLLIVCLNLANLLLARVVSRSRESAIRTALGATRLRQICQALTESLALAAMGGVLGVLLAEGVVRILLASATLDIPRLQDVRLDSTVLAVSIAITLLTGLLFGALPAWRLTRSDPQEALRAGSHTVTEGRQGLRLREGLISLEVGLSVALLVVAGLLTASLTRLAHVDKGFDPQRVLALDIRLSGQVYSEGAAQERFYDRVLPKIASIPGVQAAGFVTALPTRGQTWMDAIYLEGDVRPSHERLHPNNRYASPGYFRAMDIPILQGRIFDETDRKRRVGVLSAKAARALWPDEANPVGRTFVGEDNTAMSLVGIVADVRANLEADPPPMAYYPYWQRVPGDVWLAVRTTDPRSSPEAIRTVLRGEDAQLPMPVIRTMGEVVDESLAERRFQLALVLVFATSALLIASLGIYGVVSYSVARRRNELGIRMALGAQRSRLLGLVLRQGMAPVAAGLGIGVVVALLLGRAIRGLLFGVQPTDPATIAGVVAILLVVGVLACLIPARRAAGTDAVTALRFE